MRVFASFTFFVLLLAGGFALSRSSGQETVAPPVKEPAAPEPGADLAAIRAGSQVFVAAFEKGDAKAIAALWTQDGEYIDDTGRTFAGRSAIEQEYAAFFKEHPGHKLRLLIDSLKLLSDSAAIEDGRVILEPAPDGPPAMSRYTAVHVKVKGQWLMSTVRDARIETPSAYRRIQPLEWMIGSWRAEEHGATTDVQCRWIANKSFIQRTYTVTEAAGRVVASGVQIIGWNPQSEQLQSWTFTADGGIAVGTWTQHERGWTIDSRGALANGSPMSAVTLITHLDGGAIAWQAVSRMAAETEMPDTDEIILKRIAAKP